MEPGLTHRTHIEETFNRLALELFALQFHHNEPYRRFCLARMANLNAVRDWTQIPAVPTAVFKDLELTCLPPALRSAVFHSSGTTAQAPSRHFHSDESLAVYEASLLPWAKTHLLPDRETCRLRLCCLTPPPALAPHSSLVHMFDVIRRELGAPETAFVGRVGAGQAWTLDTATVDHALQQAVDGREPTVVLGTAFSFLHLLDSLDQRRRRFRLVPGSRAVETGGYKGRARAIPKAELHGSIAQRLGIARENIICEYGMSELSSQAYDAVVAAPRGQVVGSAAIRRAGLFEPPDGTTPNASPPAVRAAHRIFQFPHWARVQVISPELGKEAADGETGLIRVCDLANVWSVMAIQTEDLGIRRGGGFELIGRATDAEPRGCSLLAL